MTRQKWTPEQDAMLLELYPGAGDRAIMAALNEAFGTARTLSSVKNRASALGARKAEGYRPPKPRPFWTDEKRAWFRAFVPGHSWHEISAEHERLYGEPLTVGQVKSAKGALCVRSGTVGGRFEKGMVPANKGKTWEEIGISPEAKERIRRTWFKKGHVQDRPDGWIKPVGYERVNVEGYIEVKVSDSVASGPQSARGGANSNYRMKHHVVYEQAYGPIPEGCNVVFANKDMRDFRPENLVAVPRRLWATIVHDGMAYHDAETLRACMNVAMLKAAICEKERSPRACKRCGEVFAPRYARQRTCDQCLGRK